MHKIIILLILFFIKSIAIGWNDYEIKIDENYSIIRTDDINLGFYKRDGISFYKIIKDKQAGAMYSYIFTKKYIFIKHYSLKMRNKFEGDTYTYLDRDKKKFYIFKKQYNTYQVFNNENLFQKSIKKIYPKDINWSFPYNPNLKKNRIPWIMYFLPIFWFLYHYFLEILLITILFFSLKYYSKKKKLKIQE